MSQFNRLAYEKIESDCASYGADFIVVTKSQSIDTIREVYGYGHRDFGENKVQEAIPKIKLHTPFYFLAFTLSIDFL